jgi:hypothetical protein
MLANHENLARQEACIDIPLHPRVIAALFNT